MIWYGNIAIPNYIADTVRVDYPIRDVGMVFRTDELMNSCRTYAITAKGELVREFTRSEDYEDLPADYDFPATDFEPIIKREPFTGTLRLYHDEGGNAEVRYKAAFVDGALTNIIKTFPERTYGPVEACEVIFHSINAIGTLRADYGVKGKVPLFVLFNNISLAYYALREPHLYTLPKSNADPDTLFIGLMDNIERYNECGDLDGVTWKSFDAGMVGLRVPQDAEQDVSSKRAKEIERMDMQIAKFEAKMSDGEFTSKAPRHVVEDAARKLSEMKAKREALT